jgi:hypothetical protein
VGVSGVTYTIDYNNCPHCGADLFGEVIPEHIRPAGCGHRYHRGLGIEIRGVYDGVLFYACPDCHGTWHRWKRSHDERLWQAAEKHRARFTAIMRDKNQC